MEARDEVVEEEGGKNIRRGGEVERGVMSKQTAEQLAHVVQLSFANECLIDMRHSFGSTGFGARSQAGAFVVPPASAPAPRTVYF